MVPSGVTDRAGLEAAYRDGRNLAARQALYRWQRPAYDLPSIVLDLLDGRSGPVLDVGCGNGDYLRALRAARTASAVVGLNSSVGMARLLPPPVLVADAQHMPFADGSFGAELAMHMLYHLPDIDQGLTELRRVLRPDGVLLVATNSVSDKWQIWRTVAQARGDAHSAHGWSFSRRLSLESATDVLRRHFPQVKMLPLRSVISVPTADAVTSYVASYRSVLESDPVTFDRLLRLVTDQVAAEIADHGVFRIDCSSAIFVCRAEASAQ